MPGDSTFIIAEAGVNHNGSLERALGLVRAAASAGADAIKFQTFIASELVTRAAEKAAYQADKNSRGDTQHEMLGKLELEHDAFLQIQACCVENHIRFMTTPFDRTSLEFITSKLAIEYLKISSGDLTNGPLLLQASRTGLPIILSTGMSTIEEIGMALAVIAFGTRYAGGNPSRQILTGLANNNCEQELSGRVSLLHCTTAYPTPYDEVNLRAIDTMKERFNLPVGLSDHTQGINIALAAAARGCGIIEKHLTLDKNLPGPDHTASLEPTEFAQMTNAIRQIEKALGSGIKAPTESEKANMAAARRSLVALQDINAGDVFTEENLGAKRPGSGISPFEYWDWLGKKAGRDYKKDEGIA
jgi:N-acetylneuraminate synthase